MGLNPSNSALFKSFTYDGESSRDYGVFLTGEGVFDAPARSVEEIDVPGKNGTFIIDLGRFENNTLTYKAGLVDFNESDFADRISDVRNWLCSKKGYKRLSDEYNPNEYRLAAYKNGVQVEHANRETGEFEITFDCKPQRWLTSGETGVVVANNGTITNPTLFYSEPMLEVKGYGNLTVNGYDISIQNQDLGKIVLLPPMQNVNYPQYDTNFVNSSDVVRVDKATYTFEYTPGGTISAPLGVLPITSGTKTNADYESLYDKGSISKDKQTIYLTSTIYGATFSAGTSGHIDMTSTVTVQVNGVSTTITFKLELWGFGTGSFRCNSIINGNATSNVYYDIGEVTAVSTVSALGNPTYIDCEIGECYRFISGQFMGLNHLIDLGSNLPKLAPDSNTVTLDNTITELKIVPRWWKV